METILTNLYTWSKYFHVHSVKTTNPKAKENLREVARGLAEIVENLLAGGRLERGTLMIEQQGQKLMYLWRKTSSQEWQTSTINALGFEGAQVAMNLGFFRTTADKMIRHTYSSLDDPISKSDLEKMINPIGICSSCKRVAEVKGQNCPFCRRPIQFEEITEDLYAKAGAASGTAAATKTKAKSPAIEEGPYITLPPSTIFFIDPEIRQYACKSCGFIPFKEQKTADFRARDLTECPGCKIKDPKIRVLKAVIPASQPVPEAVMEPEPPKPEPPPKKQDKFSEGLYSSSRPLRNKPHKINIDFILSSEDKEESKEDLFELPGLEDGFMDKPAPKKMPTAEPPIADKPLFERRSGPPPGASYQEPIGRTSVPASVVFAHSGAPSANPPLDREILTADHVAERDYPVYMEDKQQNPPRWCMPTGNVGRTSQSQFSGPLMGHVKWTVKLASNLNTPAVVGPEHNIYIGTVESGFTQIRPDGTQGWIFHVREPVMTPACIGNNGAIYFGSHNKFFCLNTDGSPRWVHRTGSWHAPLIDQNEYVYIVSQTDLYCLYPNGRLRWSLDLGESAKLGFDLRPAMDGNGHIYLTTEYLTVISQNGKIQEKIKLLGEATPPTVDSQGRVYLGEGGVVKCMRNGTVLWTYEVEDLINTPPAVTENGYVAFGVREGTELYYLNPNGTLKWSYNLGDPVLGTPLIDNQGNVFSLTHGSKVFAVSFEGQQLWQLSGRSFGFLSTTAFNTYPALGDDGLMYVTALDGRLIAIE